MKNTTRVFDLPHKALRNALGKFSLLAGKTNYQDAKEIETLKALGAELRPLLVSHMRFEEAGILTEMDKKAPGSIDQDREEHAAVEPVQESLFVRLERLDGSQTEEEAHHFYLDFADFFSTYLKHLHHEETETEPLLKEHFTEDELREMTVAQFMKIEPATMVLWLKYGIPAFSKAQRIAMLSRVKTRGPQGAYDKTMEVLSTELSKEELDEIAVAVA